MDITRRDFINGMALSVTAGGTLSPLELLATANPAVYPPGLAGMRGNHPGSFEVAHALAREGRSWPRPETQTDTVYDLVVVGGGISGLSAAFMFRQKAGPKARILVLDNHDDFGGHAKRNEYSVDGKTIIGYGGSQSIDTPSSYSRASAAVLRDIGIRRSFLRVFRSRILLGARPFSRCLLQRGALRPGQCESGCATLPRGRAGG